MRGSSGSCFRRCNGAALGGGGPRRSTKSEVIEGHLLEIDEGALIVLDLAGASGASDGDVLELWRPLRLRHPVTKKPVVDRFLIGRPVLLTQVRERLALAKIEGKLLRPAAVGDVVILRREKIAKTEPKRRYKLAEAAEGPKKITAPSAANFCGLRSRSARR